MHKIGLFLVFFWNSKGFFLLMFLCLSSGCVSTSLCISPFDPSKFLCQNSAKFVSIELAWYFVSQFVNGEFRSSYEGWSSHGHRHLIRRSWRRPASFWSCPSNCSWAPKKFVEVDNYVAAWRRKTRFCWKLSKMQAVLDGHWVRSWEMTIQVDGGLVLVMNEDVGP